MSKAQKWLAVVLCVCFVMVSVFSVVAILPHANHECSGKHCVICLQINQLQNTLRQLSTALFAIVLTLAAGCPGITVVESGALSRPGTLIALKVQRNN